MGRKKGALRMAVEVEEERDGARDGYPDKRARRPNLARGLKERLVRAERARAFREGRPVLLRPLHDGIEPLAPDCPPLRPPERPLGESIWNEPDIPCPWSEKPEGMDST